MAVTNQTKVKFYTGQYYSFNRNKHSDGIYFATDRPVIYANDKWVGVHSVSFNKTNNKLIITVGTQYDSTAGGFKNIDLTADLSAIATTATQRANWDTAYNFVNTITATEAETDTIINKWKEIVDFLAGISDTSTLEGLLAAKVNTSRKITAGNGLTGGGNLEADRTISLAEVGEAGTYYKVVTDKYGRVTSGQTTIAISDVSSLQTILDAKVPNTRKIITKNPLSVDNGGVLSKDLTLSLKYVTSEFKVETSGANVGLLQLNAVPQSKVTGLTDALNAKLVASNIKAGNGINVTTSGNDVTIAANLYSGGALTTLNSSTDGVGIAVLTDETTITKTSGSLAIKTSSFVVNNLTSTSTTTALSANQGKVLDGKITTVSSDLASAKVDINTNALAITNINTDLTNLKSSVSALETQLTWVVVS